MATMSETKSSVSAILAFVVSCSDWVTGCDGYLYDARVAHELEYRVEITSCPPEIKLVELSSVSLAQQ